MIASGPEVSGEGACSVHLLTPTTVVSPALFVIFVFVLPLDLFMTWVFMSDKTGEERGRLKRVMLTEGALLAALTVSWTPFLVDLLDTAG